MFFVLGSFFVAAIIDRFVVKAAHRPLRIFLDRLLACFLVFLAAAAAAAYSAHVDPKPEFSRIIGIDVPPTAINLRGYRQWFDGPGTTLIFDANQPAIDSILKAGKHTFNRVDLPDRPPDEQVKMRQNLLAIFLVDDPITGISGDVRRIQFQSPQFWEEDKNVGLGHEVTRLIWDPPTGQAVLRWFEFE